MVRSGGGAPNQFLAASRIHGRHHVPANGLAGEDQLLEGDVVGNAQVVGTVRS
jgi:hypothetical protein